MASIWQTMFSAYGMYFLNTLHSYLPTCFSLLQRCMWYQHEPSLSTSISAILQTLVPRVPSQTILLPTRIQLGQPRSCTMGHFLSQEECSSPRPASCSNPSGNIHLPSTKLLAMSEHLVNRNGLTIFAIEQSSCSLGDY